MRRRSTTVAGAAEGKLATEQQEGFSFSMVISRCLKGVKVYYSGKLTATGEKESPGSIERIRAIATREYEKALDGRPAFVEFVKAGLEIG